MSSILAVEDHQETRRALGRILRANGFDVLEAGTGGEALGLLSRRPSLVVLDVVLPDMSGIDVCRRIKENDTTSIIPVVMVSGIATELQDRVKGLKGGADAYLTKPVNPDELVAYTKTLLRVRGFEEQLLEAKQQAAASEKRLRTIIDTEPACVKVVSADGALLEMNAAGLKMLGAEGLAQVKGKPILDFIAPEYHAHIRSAFDKALQGSVEEIRFEIIDLRGKRHWVESRITQIVLDEDGPPAALAITEDISERVQLEDQYRQSQKMEAFGQLAGGVAHDFNNLLTVITGYTELCLGRLASGDELAQFLGEVKKAGERAAALTRQLLAFSRKQILNPQVLDLNEVVLEMDRMLRRIIGEDINLKTSLASRLWHVRIDPGQFEQIIINLAVNSRDAMPKGGRLIIETRNLDLGPRYLSSHIEAKGGGPHVLLAVSDTGHGMSKDILARIFEPFFTTKPTGKGTGLGLATVYGIVKQSGGHVEVYSEVGKGTTFKVYLPAANQPLSVRASHAGITVGPTGDETVLLVEDDDDVRSFGQKILKQAGYNVLAAANGEEALRFASEHPGPIHVLITDVVMPEMSGRQLAQTVVTIRPETKVLYVSGYSNDAVVHHGILEGQMSFLPKPFVPVALRVKVREVLAGGRS